jgi:NAD(P)-dependent dehydrogenase (short-subunit alcohol dehydrogenase family)
MLTILVAGGAGGVGEGIVRALLRAGHRTIVPGRNPERLAGLRARIRAGDGDDAGLVTVAGAIGEPEGARAIAEHVVRTYGRIDVAIPSLGGWWEGRLLDVTPATWDAVMDEMLRTHFVFARTFVPLLQRQGGGRYLGIGGGAAYAPVTGSSLVSIAAAAQVMLTRALVAENDAPDVDILELVVDGAVHTRDSASIAEPHWITADEVGAIARDLAERGRTDAPQCTTTGPIVRMRPTRAVRG